MQQLRQTGLWWSSSRQPTTLPSTGTTANSATQPLMHVGRVASLPRQTSIKVQLPCTRAAVPFILTWNVPGSRLMPLLARLSVSRVWLLVLYKVMPALAHWSVDVQSTFMINCRQTMHRKCTRKSALQVTQPFPICCPIQHGQAKLAGGKHTGSVCAHGK